jgi:NADH:ubiquinone oxidoreductase subunit K
MVFGLVIFAIGAAGMVTRKSVDGMTMSLFVMMSSAPLFASAFARWNLLPEGNAVAVLMVACIALTMLAAAAVLWSVLRDKGRPQRTDEMTSLKG